MSSIRFDVIADGVEAPEALCALASHAEWLGYTALHLGHHAGRPDPLRALVTAAEATTRLRVGTRVLNAGLMPVAQLADEIAAVDRSTGGRFELGVGLGWDRQDFAAAGRPFEPLAARAARLETVLRSLASQLPIPIVVGGQSDAALSVAARHGGGVELTGARVVAGMHRPDRIGPVEVAERIAYLARVAAQRFRGIELGVRVHLVMVGAPVRIAARAVAAATGLPAQSIVDSPFVLVGTANEVAAKLHAAHASVGITRYSVSAASIDELAPVIQECQ